MRTTVDFNDALMREVSFRAAAENRSLKDVMSEALALGLGKAAGTIPAWTCSTHAFGVPRADYTKAWALLDEFEADQVAERRERG